jgi:hypothetical protein
MKIPANGAAGDLAEYPCLSVPLLLSLATSCMQRTWALDGIISTNFRVRAHLELNICDIHQFVEETMGLHTSACFSQHIEVDMISLLMN